MYTSNYLEPIKEQYSYYARKLLQDLGLDQLSGPLRSQVLVSIEQYLSQVLTNTILQSVDDAALESVDGMIKEGRNDDEVTAYLIASVPGIDQKISKAMIDSYAQLLEQSRVFTEAIADRTRNQQEDTPDSATPDFQ